MQRHISYKATLTRTLQVFVSLCLTVSLLPTLAFAQTSVGVSVDAPQQVNETIDLASSDTSQTLTEVETTPVQGQATQPKVPADTPASSRIDAEVALGAPDETKETLLVDGFTYELNLVDQTASLTGWQTTAPAEEVTVPTYVTTNNKTFEVVKIAGGGRFLTALSFAQ